MPPQGQHIPPLSPNPVRFYGLSIDRSVVVRRARSTDQRLSYQRNQLTINQELASSSASPFTVQFTLPPPQFVFGFGERLPLPRLPQSCKYDGAPSVLSRGAERVSMAHLVSIRVLLFCAPLMTVSNIRLIPLSPIGLGTESPFCRIFIKLRRNFLSSPPN